MARILVVDDHALNRTFLRSLLAHFGHEIAEAGDGEDALRILREKPQDLVISDLLMPVMDGQELTRHIHADAALAATPIIFYTATYRAREAKTIAGSLGVRWVLPKPSEPAEIMEIVREALGRPQSAVQPPRPTKSPEGRETSDLEGIQRLNHDLADLLGHAISVTQKQKETMSVLSTLNASLQDAESLGLRLASLVEVGIEINTQRAPSTLLDLFARASQDILSAAQVGVAISCDGAIVASSSLGLPPGAGSQIIEQVGRSKAVAFAVYEGRPVLWTAHSADPSPLPASHPPASSFLVVPVTAMGTRYGWLYAAGRMGGRDFTENDARLGAAIAAQVGVAWVNLDLLAKSELQAKSLHDEIVAHKRLSSELEESESRFRQMADNIHEAVFLIDLDSRSLVYVSPAYEEIWGRSRDTLYARPGSWLESVAASDRPRVLEEFGKARGTGKFGFECFVDRPDGSEREIRACGYPVRDAGGRIHRIAGIVQDISAKRQAERALRESERRYVDMLENIALMAVMLDCGGNVTFCNDSLLRLTGGRREEIVGGNWFQMFHTTDAESSLAVFSALLRDEPMAYHHESTVHTRSGVRRLISWNNTLLRSASGEIIGTASIGEDITEYRDSVNEIRRLNESLEERVAERTTQLEIANKELQAFAHSVSHDLRAPLNRIRGFSKILADANPAERDAREADLLGRIDNAGREMEQLIGDLMELSRVATGELQRTDVDVSAVASAMLGRFQGECPERAVDVRVEAGMRARADPGLAAVVLENLLGNAWKFTSKRHPGRIEVGIEKGGPGATSFFVRDNGAGFDVAQAARLFQPFERLHAKSEFEGTGIGLATVQRIVRRHGGRVWAEGAVDRGATFHFTLAP